MLKKKTDNILSLLEFFLYLIPISLATGSLLVNINLIIFIIVGIIYLIKENLKIKFTFSTVSLLVFFLILIFSSYLNIKIINFVNLLKSIFLLKFFLLFLIIENLFFYKKINLNYFFFISLFLSIFVSLDLLLQFFSGKNIFGFEPFENMITGIFQTEGIAGGFLQKLFVFSLTALAILISQNNRFNYLIQTVIIILIVFAIFISNNRMPFLLILFFSFLLLIFCKPFRKSFIFSFILLIPLFYFFFQNNNFIKYRYLDIYNQAIKIINIKNYNYNNQIIVKENIIVNNKNSEKKYLTAHSKIFLTTFLSFSEKKLLGNGYKSFRFKCEKFSNIENTSCATHPHNYYLEIIHDSGLIGLLFFILFFSSLLLKVILKIYKFKLDDAYKIILTLFVLNILIEIFPIKSSGSIFTTWNGTIFWVSISLLNYKYIKKND